ncbi:winged helix DNA-binding domain-containing protein [Streptomyces sp. NPDC060194]|uniref:winged helix DNA-binding domain-containing protein n=1 Tax=Streptomyces sp. NPDC060194 TaxID=3347069 RepID=UPI0036654903
MERRDVQTVARAYAQGIAGGAREKDVGGALARVQAVQAQDAEAAALGLRARTEGLTAADVTHATDVARTAVRGWFMRGTLQLIPAADARWLLDLFGPVHLALATRRLRELDLAEDLCTRASTLIARAIADEGPLTRAELTARLGTLGVPPKGQPAIHLIRRTALEGAICHGPTRDGEATFALLDDWLPADGPPAHTGDAAVTELARRYRRAHGPSDAADFAQWSGLRITACRKAWQATEDSAPESGEEIPTGDVRLLPAFDNYLVGYRRRDLSVPAEHERRVWPGGGIIRATVTLDGWAIGTWSGGRHGAEPVVELFDAADDPVVTEGVAREGADLQRFYTASHKSPTAKP